jgi:hypothetical protein
MAESTDKNSGMSLSDLVEGQAAQPEPSAAESFMTGFADSMSFGTLPTAGAVVDSLTPGTKPNIWKGDSFSDSFASNRATNIKYVERAEAAHPGWSIGGQLAGGLVVPIGAGARTVGGFVKEGITVGAAQGLGHGLGRDESAEETVKGTVEGAAVGGVLGGIVGKVASKLGLAKVAEEATAAPTPLTPEELQVKWNAGATPEELLATNPNLDQEYLKGAVEARAQGQTVRFVADDAPPPKVVGWGTDENGNPVPIVQHGEAPTGTAPPIETNTPEEWSAAMQYRPNEVSSSMWLKSPEELEHLSKTLPKEADIVDEGEGFAEHAASILEAKTTDWAAQSPDNLLGQASSIVRGNEGNRNADWLQRVTEGRGLPEEQVAAVKLQGILGGLKAQGFDLDSLPGALAADLKKAGWSGDDAEEVLRHQLANLTAGGSPKLTAEGTPAPALDDGVEAVAADAAKWTAKLEAEGDRAADPVNFRLGNLGDVSSTAGLLRSVADRIAPEVTRSDTSVMQTAQRLAAEMGESPDVLKAVGAQLGNAAEGMAALRTVWASASQEINDLHFAGIDWATADESLLASAGEAIRNLSTVSSVVQTAKAGLGRGLRVIQLPDAESYLKTLAENAAKGGSDVAPREIKPLPETREEVRDWFDLWGMTGGDPSKQAKFLQGQLTVPAAGQYLRTSFANFFTANILSGTGTVLLNIAGPAAISLVRNVERMAGAVEMAVNPFVSAADRAAARATAKATPIAYLQTLGDIGDVFKQGAMAASRNKTIIGGGGQTFDSTATYGPLTSNLLEAANVAPDWKYTIGNLVNAWPKAFARLNNGLDEGAKRFAYQGEMRVRGYQEAFAQGQDIRTAMASVREKMLGAYDAVGHAADQELLDAAERTTLTGRVGEEGSTTRKVSSTIAAVRRDIPETRFILPVFNVPANALGETLRRTPLAFIPHLNEGLGFGRTADELAGDYGPVAQADAHGRFMMGAGALMGGMIMNRMGILTGSGPTDRTDRAVWLQTHRPYSIRIGDEWVSYNKLDILGGLLSIPATISDSTVNRPADQSVSDMMLAGSGALAQWFSDRASLRTFAGLLSMGQSPASGAGPWATQFFGSMLQGSIPAPISRNMVNATDQYARMRNSWLDYMKAAIPGMSKSLEPVRNVMGEPMNRSADTYAEAFLPVTYAPATTWKTDPVMDELSRVYDVSGYGAGTDASNWGGGFFNPKQVKLEDGRSLFEHAMQARLHIKLDGMTLRDSLKELTTSAEYVNAPDSRRAAKDTDMEGTKELMLQQVFNRYNSAIKSNLAEASPMADKLLTAAAVKAHATMDMDSVSVDDLVGNPDLYRTHGVDAQRYSDKIRSGSSGALLDALNGGR